MRRSTARLQAFVRSDLSVAQRPAGSHRDAAGRADRQGGLRRDGKQVPQGSATMSDMVFLVGIPAVKIGPGQSVRSHTRDEFILDAELLDGAATYGGIIRSYFAAPRGRTFHDAALG